MLCGKRFNLQKRSKITYDDSDDDDEQSFRCQFCDEEFTKRYDRSKRKKFRSNIKRVLILKFDFYTSVDKNNLNKTINNAKQ